MSRFSVALFWKRSLSFYDHVIVMSQRSEEIYKSQAIRDALGQRFRFAWLVWMSSLRCDMTNPVRGIVLTYSRTSKYLI